MTFKTAERYATETKNTSGGNTGEQPVPMSEWTDGSHDPEVADPFATMPLDASDLEVYQLFASEMFDPSIFENNIYGTAGWDGMMI